METEKGKIQFISGPGNCRILPYLDAIIFTYSILITCNDYWSIEPMESLILRSPMRVSFLC